MKAYYNEIDPQVAQWLRVLSIFGEIAPGEIDDRCITKVRPEDLAGYERCHFFAGIGGWDYALQLAGVPDSSAVWTASLPCQPFSAAGKQRGTDDERHLWPVFRDLVAECRPAVLFGEQVASKLGRAWLASVQTDLEALGYITAAADLCAAGVGAPHIRQRLYWVAHTRSTGLEVEREQPAREERAAAERGSAWDGVVYLPCADGKARPIKPGIEPLSYGVSGRVGLLRGYGNAIVPQVAAVFIRSVMECLDVDA